MHTHCMLLCACYTLKVYRVLSADCRVLALKRVVVDPAHNGGSDGSSPSSALLSYANEIALLRRLRGDPSIISLKDAEVDAARGVIHVVMELGEIDLNQLLLSKRNQLAAAAAAAAPPPPGTTTYGVTGGVSDTPLAGGLLGAGLSPHFVRLTWLQMLEAVRSMHAQRVVHGDLKPANFVFCRGALKLIDFGIAKAIGNDTANISRDNQVGTLNYMCPEALLDTGKGAVDPVTGQKGALMKLGRASDIW
jgi:serine/threonine-protein kinase TTK/MPS1